jgi:hypothetical protein
MPMISVADAAQKYSDRTSASGTIWQEGAQRTDVDPTALAAAALPKAKANYNAAIDSGRVARALAASGKGGWLAGINRPEAVTAYTAGTGGKGKAKWSLKMNTWFPIFESLSNQIATMPKNTPQDSINRVAAWINGTIAAKQQL